MKLAKIVIPLLGLGLASCHFLSEFDESKIETTERQSFIFAQESDVSGIDLLFVVDTTDGTQLAGLENGLVQLVSELVNAQGGVIGEPGDPFEGPEPMPFDVVSGTVHVGFVSSDIGTPALLSGPAPGCTENGHGARLIRPVVPPGAQGQYLQPFLVLQSQLDEQSGETTVKVLNYRGPDGEETEISIEEALGHYWAGVMAASSTCAFQQPLNASMMALDYRVDNLGFYRDEATLGLVVVATKDDCSANYTLLGNELFSAAPGADLGPLTSFRCFEFGVQCADSDPRSPGVKSDCQDLPDSSDGGVDDSLMKPATVYANAVKQLKGGRPFIAAVLSGNTASIEVELNAQSEPQLKRSTDCSLSPITTYPAVRLQSFANAAGPNLFYSLCNFDMIALDLEFISLYENQAVERCFDTDLVDMDLNMPDLQPDCTIKLVANPGTTQETVIEEPQRCDLVDQMETCWEVSPGFTCPLALYVQYRGPMGQRLNYDVVQAECTVHKR